MIVQGVPQESCHCSCHAGLLVLGGILTRVSCQKMWGKKKPAASLVLNYLAVKCSHKGEGCYLPHFSMVAEKQSYWEVELWEVCRNSLPELKFENTSPWFPYSLNRLLIPSHLQFLASLCSEHELARGRWVNKQAESLKKDMEMCCLLLMKIAKIVSNNKKKEVDFKPWLF